MSSAWEMDTRKLDRLIKCFKADKGHVRVGILGNANRPEGKGKGPSNAVIGAAHEYGTSTLPKRSWLRQPIVQELDKKLYAKGKFDPAQLAEIIRSGQLSIWRKMIAILSEQVIQEAFDTGGFGRWKVSNMTRKKNHQTLVETGQLRKAVTSEVIDG